MERGALSTFALEYNLLPTAAALLLQADDSDTMQLASSWPFLSTQETGEIMTHAQRSLARQLDGALRRNQISFAAIPVFLLFRDHGLLDDLRLNGLSVHEPE